jgi:hypothetical protein
VVTAAADEAGAEGTTDADGDALGSADADGEALGSADADGDVDGPTDAVPPDGEGDGPGVSVPTDAEGPAVGASEPTPVGAADATAIDAIADAVADGDRPASQSWIAGRGSTPAAKSPRAVENARTTTAPTTQGSRPPRRRMKADRPPFGAGAR